MNHSLFSWKKLGINQKFGFTFVLLLVMVLAIFISGHLSFFHIGRLNAKIVQSNSIVQHVLEMDRGMERARRLHDDFFLHYRRIGLHEAHKLYAQPSVREVAGVISLGSSLEELLIEEGEIVLEGVKQADINLYLALAKRFAETSIEAVELATSRSAPGIGLEDQLIEAGTTARSLLESYPEYLLQLFHARSSYKDYLNTRKRHHMQSALNHLRTLKSVVAGDVLIPLQARADILGNIERLEKLAAELLVIDAKMSSKFNDFAIQAQSAAPVSKSLIEHSKRGALVAEKQIGRAYLTASLIMLISIALAVAVIVMIARLVQTNIIRNVMELTDAATSFSNGQLNVRVKKSSDDELGQLASSFNFMADKLTDLIDNLEIKVADRTRDLSLSEERFRKLVNELPQIAVQGFNEERDIVYWNRASHVLFGYDHKEALGRKIEELIFPEESRQPLRQAIQSWLEEGRVPEPGEQLLIDKDGREKPVYSAFGAQTDSQGSRTMYCVHVDLGKLKHAEAKGRISELFYRQLFDHSSSGVAVYEVRGDGHDFILKDINAAVEKIEQIRRDEVIGKSITEVFPGAEAFGLIDVLKKVWNSGEPLDHPESHYRDERIQGWRENKVYKLPSGEVVAVYNDVTERKRMEEDRGAMELRLQRAKRMEAMGLMAGGIAHDLNNILSSIVGYPELILLQLPPDSKLRKPLAAMKDAGERAAAVVDDLLTVARGVASIRSRINLNTLIEEYLDSPEHSHLQRLHPHVRFRADMQEDLPLVECSPVHVKKCIMNLTVNAAEAIEKTGEIRIATRVFMPDKAWLAENGLEASRYSVLSVTDTGSGIPTEDIEKIFEPFYTKKVLGKRSGTGLGLSVVWNTMKEHGGTVVVSSASSGTCFELYFPAQEMGSPIEEEDEIPTEIQKGRGQRILVIDDEPQQCELAKAMLEHLGYEADCAHSGEEALARIEENKIQLVLLDMLMEPGMNGRETFSRLKQMDPFLRALIASGFSENEDVQATLRMGARAFIRKPYSISELGKAIHDSLEDA